MKKLCFALGLLAISASLNSCIKKTFDNPPDASQVDPNLPVNASIGDLATMALNMGNGNYRTLGDTTIAGIVTADDRSGNFYKQIVIQDSLAGITISIAQNNLYNDYPIGRKVYIKLNGLVLINYKGLPEIVLSATLQSGSVTVTGIPSGLVNNYIVKATYPVLVTPLKVRMTDLFSNTNNYLNKLVEIENMEFAAGSNNVPYASSYLISSATNRTVQDCPFTGSMIMYNSAYATFANSITPSGKGTLTGIFSMYNSVQFLIRDTTDVQFTDSRDCP